jgi:hypothetical protein
MVQTSRICRHDYECQTIHLRFSSHGRVFKCLVDVYICSVSNINAGSHIASMLAPHQYLHGTLLLLYVPRLSSCLIHLRLVGNGAMHYNTTSWRLAGGGPRLVPFKMPKDTLLICLPRAKRPLCQVMEWHEYMF